MEPDAALATPPKLGLWKWIQVACLSVYCAAAILFPIYYLDIALSE